jgi:ABC-type multidrug transport system permease subunit
VASPSTNVALALAGPVLVPLMIFSGVLLNFDSIPRYFIWLRYMSWFSYANELLVVNQWQNVTNISCPFNVTIITQNGPGRCFQVGEDIINNLKIDPVGLFYYNI